MKKEREEPITATNQLSEAGISALHGAGGRHQPIRRGEQMSVELEITGRLGQLQADWLREHYSTEQIANALASLPATRRPYPLNAAKVLATQGGPVMPPAEHLLANDPVTQAESAKKKADALARIRELRAGLR